MVNEFLLNLKRENKSAKTIMNYKYILQEFFKDRKVSYLLITSNDINKLIEERRKIRTKNTIRSYLVGLSSFYGFCVEKQYMETKPIRNEKSERYWETNISISNDENQKRLNSFLLSLKEANKSKSTIVNIREFLQSFLETREEKISALTSDDIKDYLEVHKINCMKEKVNIYISYMRSFINFCVEKCHLEKSPNIQTIFEGILKKDEVPEKYWVVISLPNQNNEEVLNEYLLSLKVSNYSKGTILGRRNFLQSFFREEEELFSNLKSNEILEKIKKVSKGKKEKTISNYISDLKCFYAFCIEEDYLESSPIKSRWFPRLPQPVPKYLEKEEIVKVQQRMEKENIRNRALFEFLLTSGCRIGEVHNIERENIDFEKRTVLVLGKGRKYRQVHFSVKCSLLLERYLDSRKDNESALFVTLNGDFHRLSADTMRKLLVKLGKEVGLRGTLHPHRLRHTFATDLLAKGAELSFIADELGHSNLMTTQVYARLPKREIISMYRKYMG
ncbi:tyrosine-type recombinase/integrase [Gottfriedia solisilvae]|uniref:tyrosine-type recombinase/integrase n=1 Tax=Gottfriedia solisilvae TaxID=1516104 RepID=UPI001FCFCC28|nr:tyrosine-type recombinase/integrase [Gottfriedia solisilvae]